MQRRKCSRGRYVDTTVQVDGVNVGQVEGVSKSAYSPALIYEDERWSAQIAADHSGEYTEVAYQLTDKIRARVASH